jgi:hypothetical protein
MVVIRHIKCHPASKINIFIFFSIKKKNLDGKLKKNKINFLFSFSDEIIKLKRFRKDRPNSLDFFFSRTIPSQNSQINSPLADKLESNR